jgi:hypothetical protein
MGVSTVVQMTSVKAWIAVVGAAGTVAAHMVVLEAKENKTRAKNLRVKSNWN